MMAIGKKRKGFTLVELMIVVTILAVLTPVIFRLYHVGLKSGADQVNWNTVNLADTAMLMEYMEDDFRAALSLANEYSGAKAGDSTLILRLMPRVERKKLMSAKGNLAGRKISGRFEVVVYSLTEKGDLVRTYYGAGLKGDAPPAIRKILMTRIDRFRLDYNGLSPENAGLVRVGIGAKPLNPDVRSMPLLSRVFKLG